MFLPFEDKSSWSEHVEEVHAPLNFSCLSVEDFKVLSFSTRLLGAEVVELDMQFFRPCIVSKSAVGSKEEQ